MSGSGHGPGAGGSCGQHSHVIDLKTAEAGHAVFVSHSRRDPAALNLAYAIVGAWRHGTDEHGNPFCAAAQLPNNTVCIWLDKEQMQESGGVRRPANPGHSSQFSSVPSICADSLQIAGLFFRTTGISSSPRPRCARCSPSTCSGTPTSAPPSA